MRVPQPKSRIAIVRAISIGIEKGCWGVDFQDIWKLEEVGDGEGVGVGYIVSTTTVGVVSWRETSFIVRVARRLMERSLYGMGVAVAVVERLAASTKRIAAGL
jgi:hypothetical protein